MKTFRFGIFLMVFGEIGNFSAYGFAPASLVAPLGTTTVIGKQEKKAGVIGIRQRNDHYSNTRRPNLTDIS